MKCSTEVKQKRKWKNVKKESFKLEEKFHDQRLFAFNFCSLICQDQLLKLKLLYGKLTNSITKAI